MKLNNLTTSLLFSIILPLTIAGQNTENSPLSRFGFGDIRNSNPSWLTGMGNAGVGFSSENLFSPMNPASSSFLKQTDIEIGLFARTINRKDRNGASFSEWTGGIQNIQLAIPLQNSINDLLDRKTRKDSWGLSFGLSPYSSLGYNSNVVDSTNPAQVLSRTQQGDGGITAFNIGLSYRYKEFAVGLGFEYLFGNMNHNQNLYFESIIGSHDSYLNDRYHLTAWKPSLGLMYRIVLNQKLINKDNNLRRNILSFGLNATLPSNYNITYSALHVTRYDEQISITDTVLYLVDQKSKGDLPFGIKAGAMYSHQDRSGLLLSLGYDLWKNENFKGGLLGASEKALGIQLGGWYRKGQHHFDPFWKKSTFRFGLYYQQDYRLIQNEQAHSLGLTFGWAYPIVFLRQDAQLHLNFDLGQRKLGSIFKENYFQITMGITINDNEWFLKRRYN